MLGGPKAPALAKSPGRCCPRAAGSGTVGLPPGRPKASKVRLLPEVPKSLRPSTIGGAVSRRTLLHRATLPSSPRGVRLCDRALRRGCLPPEGGGLPRRAAAVWRFPKVPSDSRWPSCSRRSTGLASRWSLRRAASPSCVPLPEGRLVQGGSGRRLPSPKSGALLSLRPIGSSEEDPAFRPNAASVHSVATSACPEGPASPARRLSPSSVSVMRLRPPVADGWARPAVSPPRRVKWLRFRSDRRWAFEASRPCEYLSRSSGFAPSRSRGRLPEGCRWVRPDGKPPGRGSSRQHRSAGYPSASVRPKPFVRGGDFAARWTEARRALKSD